MFVPYSNMVLQRSLFGFSIIFIDAPGSALGPRTSLRCGIKFFKDRIFIPLNIEDSLVTYELFVFLKDKKE